MLWLIQSDGTWDNIIVNVPPEIKEQIKNSTEVQVALSQMFITGVKTGLSSVCKVYFDICEPQIDNSTRLPLVSTILIKEPGEINISKSHYVKVASTLGHHARIYITSDNATNLISATDTRGVKVTLLFHVISH